ncbi:MAG: hypothetical protein E5X48_03590, partial [Mesorhizobium sp.]|uniref:beta strand repeat-containing protein n=1 Tax=Mesorhizobium sp. TaxID=1871066 RepID=UPI001219457B
MTTSIEFDAVANSWDSTVGEHPIAAGVQVAQAASGQAAGEPVPVDVGKGAPAQGADNAQGANKPAADANAPAANARAANAAASNVPHEYHAEAGNVVKLPANVSIDNIKVKGHNLVLQQPDGSEIVIKDGALNVPTFIIGDVEVPRVALIAALEASHVDVAFGADGSISAGGNGSPSSAGGNFEHPAGGIGDGFGLTSLLPPTDLAFGQPENRELFPSVAPDRGVSVVAVSLLNPDEAASETGLNGGPTQSPGSDAPSSSETSSIGTISIDAPDGIGSIVINGVAVTAAGQQIQGQFGYLTIVSINPNTGAIEYNYTVTESVTHPTATNGYDQSDTVPDNFSITVTDSDGDTASTTFAVAIIDDVPTAIADTDSLAAGQFGPATGNVLLGGTDAGDANTTDGVADVQGADGAKVVGVAKGTTNADLDDASTLDVQVQGAYGKLTLHADGSYTYVRDANTPGGVNDVFTYTIKDGDGDTSHTTLTISIGNSTPEITDLTQEANGGDVVVNEAALNVGTPGGPGSDPASTAETGTGSFTISSPDGVASLTIDGHDFITNGVFSAGSFTTALGNTLTVTGYNAATGVVSYTYTLLDNETHATGAGTNSLFENMTVSLTDQDGQNATGTLSVNIVDDVPTATNDGPYTVVEDGAGAANTPPTSTVSGDVLANDASGADTPKSFVGWSAGDAAAIAALNTYGTLTQNANGTWSYVLDNSRAATQALTAASNLSYTLHYTMQDADGDTSSATLTINVTGANDTASVVTASAQGPDNTVYEAGLNPNGSNAVSNTETSTGSFTIAASDGIQNIVIGGTTFTLAQIQAFNGTQTVNTGEGILTLTGYSGDAHSGTVSYSYTLSATIDNDSKVPTGNDTVDATGFNDSVALTVNGAGGTTASDNLVVHVVDDVPTATNDGPYTVVEDG